MAYVIEEWSLTISCMVDADSLIKQQWKLKKIRFLEPQLLHGDYAQ